MKLKLPSLSLLALVTFLPAHAAVPKPRELVREALEAQGGEQKLRALESVQWEASGYRNELEQSERPEGPYIVQMNEISEVHDLEAHRYRYQQISSLSGSNPVASSIDDKSPMHSLSSPDQSSSGS